MTFSFRSAAAVAVLAITTFGAAAPANATLPATPAGSFEVNISPDKTGKYTAFVYDVTITNSLSSRHALGSVNLTAPDGFKPVTASAGRVEGQVVKLRDLALQPGQETSFTVTADNTMGNKESSWDAEGAKSNDLNGTGNRFLLVEATSDLKTGVSDSFTTECADDQECELKAQWQGPDPHPDSPLPVPLPVGGVQSRQSTSLQGADVLPSSTYTVTVTVTASPLNLEGVPDDDAGTLSLELNAPEIDCVLNTETSPITALANFFRQDSSLGQNPSAMREKTVVFVVDGDKPLPRSQGMCFGAPVPFAAAPLTATLYRGTTPFFTGTLPDCGPQAVFSRATPCTSAHAVDTAGNQKTVVRVPARPLDPAYRP